MPLTPEEIEDLRTELERERARLERSAALSQDAAKPVQLDQSAIGRLSRMNEMQNQHLAADLHEREAARLAQIVDALERIASGRYGRCARCERDIPYGRLMVFPEARLCVTCEGRA
jgi:DnaK suppressor protein